MVLTWIWISRKHVYCITHILSNFSVQWQKPKSLQGRFQCDKTAKRNCTYVSAIYLFPTVKLQRNEVQLEKICLMLVLTRSLHAWHTFIKISVDLTLTMFVHRIIMQWFALWCDIVIIYSNRTFSKPSVFVPSKLFLLLNMGGHIISEPQ